MKFLHTSDWQIGMGAAHVGEAGDRVRRERLRAAERVVAAAREAGAEFLLLAGDTFEHNGVDRPSVQQVGDILAAAGRPVFLIPGNHDPLTPGSVWEHPVWQAANLHVLRTAEAVDLGSAKLFPCPLVEAHSRRDPTLWITPDGGNTIRIGMAHGSVEGVSDDLDYPIARNAPGRAGLDYLALGHWHSYAPYSDAQATVRMAYSGTHETTKFGERESGNALIVEIASPSGAPLIQPVRTGGLAWRDVVCDLRTAGQVEEVFSEIDGIEKPDSALVRIRLTGLIFAADLPKFRQLRDIMDSNRFLFGRMDDSGLRPAPEDAAWVDALPDGILREAALRLRETDGETAANALIELYSLAQEVSA